MDLIVSEHKSIGTVYFMMSEENIRLQLRQPWIKFGTDAEGIDPEHATQPGPSPRLRHISAHPGQLRARREGDAAGRGDPQDDIGRRRPAVDPRSRPAYARASTPTS